VCEWIVDELWISATNMTKQKSY